MTSALSAAYGRGGTGVATGERSNPEELCGFIFMCNGKTKEECYRYRVFGLPAGRMNVVEKIKPGMKLFLFDFEVKLLYGAYEATSGGVFNLQPAAFGGKFQSQVGFRIYEDCLPLPESSFKFSIQSNYYMGKFKQELNVQQVSSLLSLFRPLTMPSSVHQSVPLPISGTVRLPRQEGYYTGGMQFRNNSTLSEPQHSQNVVYPQYIYHRTLVNPSHTHMPVESESQNLAAAGPLHAPYVPRVQRSPSQTMAIIRQADQCVLPSQYASYGAKLDGSCGHLEPNYHCYQSMSAVSDYSTGPQQADLIGNYTSTHPDQYRRVAGGMFSSDNQLGSGSDYHQSQSQTENQTTMQQIQAIQYYPYSVPTTLHAPPHQQFYAQTTETS